MVSYQECSLTHSPASSGFCSCDMVHSLTPPQYNRLSPSGLSRSPLLTSDSVRAGLSTACSTLKKFGSKSTHLRGTLSSLSRLDAVPVRASFDAGFAGICVVAAPGSLRHLSGHTSRCDLLAIHGSCQGWPVHAGSAPREGSPSCRRSLPARNRSHRLAITVLRWFLASLSYSNSVVRPSASTRRRSKSFAPTVRRPGDPPEIPHSAASTRPPPLVPADGVDSKMQQALIKKAKAVGSDLGFLS